MLSSVVPANGITGVHLPQNAFPAAGSVCFSAFNLKALWNKTLSGFGWPSPASTPPGQYRPSFFERRERVRYASDVEKIDLMRTTAADLWKSGRTDDAAKAYSNLAVSIWSLSQTFAVGRWDAAEEAMIRGALIMAGRDPELFSDEDEVARHAVPVLLQSGKIRRNSFFPDSDLHVISRELGMGGQGTVYKIFGRDQIIKIFDDGGMRFSTEYIPTSFRHKQQSIRREIEGFQALAKANLASVHVYQTGNMYYCRDLIYGIVRRGIEVVLGLDEIPSVIEKLENYKNAMAAAGIFDFDGNYDGNFVYRRDGNWVVIDF